MARHDDIGTPTGGGSREALIKEIDRDQRNEAVDELFDEARDLYWQAGGAGLTCQETDDSIKAIMRLCWERWQ